MTAQVTYVNAPDGVAHTADTVRRMAALARKGAHTYPIRSLATKIVHDVPSKDIQGELAALYRWVRDNIRYRFDPLGLEWVQAPERTIKERAGDCDDIAVLLASLVQALGHKTRFQTVGASKKRQSHVYAQAWDRKQWVTLDPVLEPKQATTEPRADLGAFGRVAPGATRTYNDKGQPMAGVRTKSPSVTRLWQPTVFERSRFRRDKPNPIYRGHGSAGKTQLVRVSLWNNALDPFDLAGLDRDPDELGDLGFNFMKAIGSVAKVASAVGVPGAGTVAMAADIGGKLMPGKKKAAAPRAAVPVAARPAASPYAPSGGSSFGPPAQQVNLAPIVSAALQSSRDAIKALSAQNAQAINAITGMARGQVASAKPKKKKKAKPAKKRQRWDPVARRWVVYQERGTVGALTPRLHFTLGAQAPGVDLDAARALAVALVNSIKAKGRRYDQTIAAQFQRAAGIGVDGKYGGATAGAVRYFTGKKPPAPMVRPYVERRYTPPATVTREPTPAAAPPSAGYAPAPSAPRAPVQVSAGSRSTSAPIVISPQPLSRREMAANLVRMVQASIQATGKPPTGNVTGAVTYQRAAGIGADGKWGPQTRAAAARDLGVSESSLPRSAWDKKKPKKPKPAPAPRQQTAPTSAPTPSAPAVYDPVSSGTRDPGLPMFPGDTGPKPIDITTMKEPAEKKRDNTPIALLGLLWWQSRRKRAA